MLGNNPRQSPSHADIQLPLAFYPALSWSHISLFSLCTSRYSQRRQGAFLRTSLLSGLARILDSSCSFQTHPGLSSLFPRSIYSLMRVKTYLQMLVYVMVRIWAHTQNPCTSFMTSVAHSWCHLLFLVQVEESVKGIPMTGQLLNQ